MTQLSYSRFMYCDTNILSHLAKHRELWAAFTQYLLDHDLVLAVGSQVAELADAPALHDALTTMLLALPAAIIKQWDLVLTEEVQAHPETRRSTLLSYPLNALLLEEDGPTQFAAWLSSDALRQTRNAQLLTAQQLAGRHADLKANFPPTATGKYERSQAPAFAFAQTVQWLVPYHHAFLDQFRSDVEKFNAHTFRSVRLTALVIFYKYYLGQRDPRRQSDFGDLSHLFAIPYCTAAIMERDLANILRQIQRHDDVLRTSNVWDIDFVETWPVPTAG